MRSLKEQEIDAQIDWPEPAARALKAVSQGIATAEQQQLAFNFIVFELAGVDKLAFAVPGSIEMMAWQNGRRYIGKLLQNVAIRPILPQPTARLVGLPRTMTGKRRARAKTYVPDLL